MVTPTPVYAQAPYNSFQTIANADAQTVKALTATSTDGIRINAINVVSTDTSARDIVLYIQNASTNYPLGTFNIPATAGAVNTVATVNLLQGALTPGAFPSLPFDSSGNPYIDLASGSNLAVSAPVTVTSAKVITITAIGGTF